ncbi:hypothetical protein MMC25_007931 [Agyrium rufum]|nr:hypothetical protein [Agyrium rufum]
MIKTLLEAAGAIDITTSTYAIPHTGTYKPEDAGEDANVKAFPAVTKDGVHSYESTFSIYFDHTKFQMMTPDPEHSEGPPTILPRTGATEIPVWARTRVERYKRTCGIQAAHRIALSGQLVQVPLRKDVATRIFDSSTDTGLWAVDVAITYPLADVIGADESVPRNDQVLFYPRNVSYRFRKILKPWPECEERTFDLVHQRGRLSQLTDAHCPRAIQVMYDLLKPGGWIQIVEGDHDPARPSIHDSIKDWLEDAGFTEITMVEYEVPRVALYRDTHSTRPDAIKAVLVASKEGVHVIESKLSDEEYSSPNFREYAEHFATTAKAPGNPPVLYWMITGKRPESTTITAAPALLGPNLMFRDQDVGEKT